MTSPNNKKMKRTPEGEKAWKDLRVPMEERRILSLLQLPYPHKALQDMLGTDVDIMLISFLRRGWIEEWDEETASLSAPVVSSPPAQPPDISKSRPTLPPSPLTADAVLAASGLAGSAHSPAPAAEPSFPASVSYPRPTEEEIRTSLADFIKRLQEK